MMRQAVRAMPTPEQDMLEKASLGDLPFSLSRAKCDRHQSASKEMTTRTFVVPLVAFLGFTGIGTSCWGATESLPLLWMPRNRDTRASCTATPARQQAAGASTSISRTCEHEESLREIGACGQASSAQGCLNHGKSHHSRKLVALIKGFPEDQQHAWPFAAGHILCTWSAWPLSQEKCPPILYRS